jgi:flagellar motor switch protein FliN/FliY
VAEEKDDGNLETPDELNKPTEEPDGVSGEGGADADSKPMDASESPDQPEEDDGAKDLDFILDIPLKISVELGRTQMLINDLLRLGQGSIVELSKLADEPMDIFVNRKLFARGEVVVVNEKFGIRLTDIISPAERVKSLG